MAHCPSQDWDAYVNAQDDAIVAEVAWWRENRDRVLQVACAILSNEDASQPPLKPTALIDHARDVVLEITRRARDPYE